MEFNACIVCRANPCRCTTNDPTDESRIIMRMDLNSQEGLDVMRYFMQKFWKMGRKSTLAQVIGRLHALGYTEAATAIESLKEMQP